MPEICELDLEPGLHGKPRTSWRVGFCVFCVRGIGVLRILRKGKLGFCVFCVFYVFCLRGIVVSRILRILRIWWGVMTMDALKIKVKGQGHKISKHDLETCIMSQNHVNRVLEVCRHSWLWKLLLISADFTRMGFIPGGSLPLRSGTPMLGWIGSYFCNF